TSALLGDELPPPNPIRSNFLNRTLTANILRRDSQLNGEAARFAYDIVCPKKERHWLHLHFT
ncbi:hypothetical protein, partial [Lactobacillus delbrueckii]|uniref:hypothetical protein n=1 Tax=Lactobacillus delbrueckii TaxID=1584 RepID=UPI001E30D24D